MYFRHISNQQGGVYRKMPYVDDDFAISFGKYPHVANLPIFGYRQKLTHRIPGEDSNQPPLLHLKVKKQPSIKLPGSSTVVASRRRNARTGLRPRSVR